ncbi:MAG: sigma-54 dependent transcriptional regulator [Polyangia bacterium]
MTEQNQSEARLLVVDDDVGVVDFLSEMLTERGYCVQGLTSARAALLAARSTSFDLVISDVEMPELRGIDLVAALSRVPGSPPVLLMTAFGSIDLAVQAVRGGACDFLTKPFAIESLYEAVDRALRERNVRREIVRLRATRPAPTTDVALISDSAAMKRVLDVASRAARTDSTVLLTGETGTGKTTLARFIHAQSHRQQAPFVAVNCGALPSTLIEAELFGVHKGAFTDAQRSREGLIVAASGGTLFLDEVGEIPLDSQAKLLHVLESSRVRPLGSSVEVSVKTRLVAATNQSLESLVREGRFRPDLFYRLNVIRIEIPSLRQRPEDIPALVDHFLAKTCSRLQRPLIGISAAALEKLTSHRYPGNVRELANTIERAVALTEHSALIPQDIELTEDSGLQQFLSRSVREGLPLADLERAYVHEVLREHQGNKAAAARALSIDRGTLYRKLS